MIIVGSVLYQVKYEVNKRKKHLPGFSGGWTFQLLDSKTRLKTLISSFGDISQVIWFVQYIFHFLKLFQLLYFSPYSDMALLPILAFFFCSAGPFLFVLFLIKRVFLKLKHFFMKDKNDNVDRKGFEAVKTIA